MKIGFDKFFNKYGLLKKTLLGLFIGSSAAGAQTIYQCTPCPSGQSSNPGATGVSQCFNPSTKTSSSVIFSGTTNWSGSLQPGWYRISLKGAKGSDVSCSTSAGGYSSGSYPSSSCVGCSYSSSSCTGYGANGGTAYYIFYISNTASASYTYNSGSPKLVVTESGKSTRTFQVTAGTSGSKWTSGSYGSVCNCSNGSAGTSSISGLTTSTDKSTSNVDNWSSVGGKLVKL